MLRKLRAYLLSTTAHPVIAIAGGFWGYQRSRK